MLRHLYRAAVRLHPPGFRNRFGEEILSIFESTQGKSARFSLLCDCLLSSLRQRILRFDFSAKSSPGIGVPAADRIPSFSSLEGFRPRTSAVIDGVILSAHCSSQLALPSAIAGFVSSTYTFPSTRPTVPLGCKPQVQANCEASPHQSRSSLRTQTTNQA